MTAEVATVVKTTTPKGGSKAGVSGGLRGYLTGSRDLFTSLVLVMPLFIFYQVGVLATGGLRNGVDFVTTALFTLFDGSLTSYAIFNFAVLGLFGGALVTLRNKGTFQPRLFPWMLLESTVYALLLGSVVVKLIDAVGLGGVLEKSSIELATGAAKMGFLDKLVMSAGAGLYEEIVFRLFLMGGMFLALTRILGVHRLVSAVVAVIASSVIFSAAHHISEPFTMGAFTFRVFAGMIFAVLYQTRGFAVAAYTHCIYDVWVMVFHDQG